MDIAAERAYPSPLSNSPLLPLLLLSLATQKHAPDTTNIFKNEYDYIVVGAGSAGSVVASRLSEYPCVSVLLLEAGGRPPLLNELPPLSLYLLNSDVAWKYLTTPQLNTGAAFPNRKLPWPVGKMLGGSSSLSFMIYGRGNMRNYDDWECQGAKGWGYKGVYPYFLKLEDNRDPEFASNGYHSFGGPNSVEQPRYEPELKAVIREAAHSLGYQILDSNAIRQTGFYDHQASMRNSQRCSTAKAYLVPAENRTNLDIVTNAFVTKVVVENGAATGVQFDHLGLSYRVKAKREVIVSAGANNTPKILKLSGIGPRTELDRLNIPVVADLPGVGENFQNHGAIDYFFVVNPSIPEFDHKLSNPDNIYEYIGNRSGPLASSGGAIFTAFLKGLEIYPTQDFPNYALYFIEMPTSVVKNSGIKEEVYNQVFGPYGDRAMISCTIQQVQPYSRGTVTLQSANPYLPPLIEPNFLANPRDVEDLVEGLKNCKRLVDTDAFKRFGARPLETLLPGCEKYHGNDDEYFRCQLKSVLNSYFHAAGTAKMGNPADPMTVVDPELRVKNVRNLRVVDASIMPTIISGNPNIPTIMIAEKASDMIKETINCFENRCQENIYQPYSGHHESLAFEPLDRFQFSNVQAWI